MIKKLILLFVCCFITSSTFASENEAPLVNVLLDQLEKNQNQESGEANFIENKDVNEKPNPKEVPVFQSFLEENNVPLSRRVIANHQGYKDQDRDPIMIDMLELRDMDIKDVLKLIARKTGLNIVAGSDVSGRVTLFLRDVEVHEALSIILNSNNLAYIEENNIIRILPAAEYESFYGRKFGQPIQARVIKLRGLKSSDVAVLLNEMKSSVGKVITDDKSNTIMLVDIPTKLDEMEAFLYEIDHPLVGKVFDLHYVEAEGIAPKIEPLLTQGIGMIKFDVRSNKLYIKDTKEKIKEVSVFIQAVDVPQSTQVFDVSYAKVDEIAATVEKVLTPGVGQVEFDVRSNKLIVMDTVAKINEIAEMMIHLDRKEKEVLVDARIVQVTLTDGFRMGIDWDQLLPDTEDMSFSSNFGGLGAAVPNKATLTIGTLNFDHYSIVIDALEEMGHTSVLSNPRVAVVNNEEAKILVGTTQPYVTSSVTQTDGSATTAETVNFIDVGVKLFVTPKIHHDDYITLKIKPEVSTAATSLETSEGNFIPIVDTSEVETTVRVKDGVTIVIGGLIKEEEVNDIEQLPVFGRIPLIGRAFRNETRSKVKTEIVIFLTPHIITGDVQAPASSEPLSEETEYKIYSYP